MIRELEKYYYRISIMSRQEILFRLKDEFRSIIEFRFRKFWKPETCLDPGHFRPIPFFRNSSDNIINQLGPKYNEDVEDIAKGELEFCRRKYHLGNPIKWYQDYETGIEIPLVRGRKHYSLKIYDISDMTFVRAINRHAFLVFLSIYAGITGNHIAYLKKTMLNWIDRNPYLEGINWSDSSLISQRLINWCIILSNVYDRVKDDSAFVDRVCKSIVQQATFIRRHPSLYSSANNHLLVELIGTLLTCLVLRESNFCRKYCENIKRELAQQVDLQYYKDGFNKEQSISYHYFTVEYLLLLLRTADSFNVNLPDTIRETIKKAIDALFHIVPEEGQIPQFGDGGFENHDDIFYLFFKDPYRKYSLLNQGAVYFNRQEWFKTKFLDKRTILMFGGNIQQIEEDKNISQKEKKNTDCGYIVLERKNKHGISIRIVFDGGPFGYPPTYAHAHADALSFTLDIDGIPFLIDPGTFTYHLKGKKWRNYFRGTRAHNTVVIDDSDQAKSGGDMLWQTCPEVKITGIKETEKISEISAEHDGYKRLKDGVIHQRELTIQHELNQINIIDTLKCKSTHNATQCFHFSPGLSLKQISPNAVLVNSKDHWCKLLFEKNAKITVFYGNEEKPAGWYSGEHNIKVPSYSIFAEQQINGLAKIGTIINVGIQNRYV